jgi:hypothetical protein
LHCYCNQIKYVDPAAGGAHLDLQVRQLVLQLLGAQLLRLQLLLQVLGQPLKVLWVRRDAVTNT